MSRKIFMRLKLLAWLVLFAIPLGVATEIAEIKAEARRLDRLLEADRAASRILRQLQLNDDPAAPISISALTP